MPRHVKPRSLQRAHGRNINLLLIVLAMVAAYVGWTLLQPQLVAYELKGAMKVICNSKIRETLWQLDDSKMKWKREWQSRHRRIVGPLHDDQWEFKISNPCARKDCSCTAEAIFERETHWQLLEDLIEIKPYKTVHNPKVYVDYIAEY